MAAPGPFRIANPRASRVLLPVFHRLPAVEGRVIEVGFQPELTAYRGKLLSCGMRGTPIHAGSHVRKRSMVLDSALLREPAELQRIFVHEIHHFVWIRLGNPKRKSFDGLVSGQSRAAGELGWSAEGLKTNLREGDQRDHTRRWRDYVCECFCDTAAWFYSSRTSHPEWTLALRYRAERKRWFGEYFEGHPLFL